MKKIVTIFLNLTNWLSFFIYYTIRGNCNNMIGVMCMKANVGKVDRIIRLILGIILLALLFILDGNIRYIGLLGIVLIFTAIVSWCPLYIPFKINTKKD